MMHFLKSTIGQKLIMAVTGVILFGFVVAHMIGNLLIYQGPEALNDYAVKLRSFPVGLWGARIALLAATMLHVHTAIALTIVNRKARPIAYARRDNLATSYAARTMRWSGVIILLFIVYHLLHFTFGTVGPDGFDSHDVYGNVVRGFQVPFISACYIFTMLILALHLYHGLWSGLQTLGINHPKYNACRRAMAAFFAGVIFIGNASIPIFIMIGVIK